VDLDDYSNGLSLKYWRLSPKLLVKKGRLTILIASIVRVYILLPKTLAGARKKTPAAHGQGFIAWIGFEFIRK
jgi:hypothetical protein